MGPHRELTTFRALLARYGPDGAPRWSRAAEGEQTVFMAAQVAGASLSAGAFLLELDGDGRVLRAAQCGAAEGRRYARGLAVSHGTATVAGALIDSTGEHAFLWRAW